MSVEVCGYSLSWLSKPVGSQILRTSRGSRTVDLEARLLLQGALGQYSVTQTSRLLLPSLESARFTETSESRGEARSFEVAFDQESGLVRAARRAGKETESAEVPYLRPYSDPLGLLYRLRQRPDTLRVPMLGKDVLVERLSDLEVETFLGVRHAHAYLLHPGPGYVYVEAAPPHLILRLTQRLEGGLLDAFLTRIAQEEGRLEEPTAPARRRRRGGKRRRRRVE